MSSKEGDDLPIVYTVERWSARQGLTTDLAALSNGRGGGRRTSLFCFSSKMQTFAASLNFHQLGASGTLPCRYHR